jgi:hypothetical protein
MRKRAEQHRHCAAIEFCWHLHARVIALRSRKMSLPDPILKGVVKNVAADSNAQENGLAVSGRSALSPPVQQMQMIDRDVQREREKRNERWPKNSNSNLPSADAIGAATAEIA